MVHKGRVPENIHTLPKEENPMERRVR